ncbi:SLBB domain-containing protein [Pseudomonadales bacterium]|nr:SLBB domain-containing protein [Pseudomonadales bacterium]
MNIKLSLSGLLCGTVFLLTSSMSLAQTPTAAQIEQFKSLPAAQQQALARQYGVDLDALSKTKHAQPNLKQAASGHARRAASTAGETAIEKNAVEASNKVNLAEVKEEKVTKQQLKQFGYELFDGTPGSFMPATDIPIPSEYVMGPGDNIIVQLYGKENQSYALTINREGEIQFPNLGPMVVAGLSFTDVKALIGTMVSEQMIGVKVSVTVGALRSIRIFILGAAKLPGSYTINSLSTMTNALFASGGISKAGSLRNIQLKRGGKLVTSLDLYDLLLSGDTSSDTRLLPGDVIFIPSIGKTVGVSGEVRRPAIYELKDETTSEQVVALAGGFLPTAYPQVSRIERINSRGERTLVDVDLKSKQGKSLPIRDADILQVFSVLNTMEDIVVIEGHIKRPGGSAWRAGLSFSDIVSGADALLPNADLNAALIVSELEPTQQIEVKFFSPAAAFASPRSASDPVLNARDKVLIFDFQSNRATVLKDIVKRLAVQANGNQRRQLVSINGSVRFPGQYPLVSNASANDIIALAGGLTDRAFSLGAEITRYVFDEQQQQVTEHINIDLKSAAGYSLVPEDAIQIKHLPSWVGTETIELEGEVVFPGTYTIQRGETLSQVIQRAGGLTEYAFIEASIFSRAQLRSLEAQRLKELKQQLTADIAAANLQEQSVDGDTQLDTQNLLSTMEGMRPTGRMVIDLANIIKMPEQHDVVLKNGDRLTVPKQSQSVTVVGEVQYATSHIFESKLSVNDYIERSGGTNIKADKKRIYVVRANGSVFLPSESRWFKRGDSAIQPGDTVVVPLDADRMKKLTLWASISEIVYRMALGAAAVASF